MVTSYHNIFMSISEKRWCLLDEGELLWYDEVMIIITLYTPFVYFQSCYSIHSIPFCKVVSSVCYIMRFLYANLFLSL